MRWEGQVFLSYDSRDGSQLADLLRDELDRGNPTISCSIDLTTIDPDDALDEVAATIDRCACFLFVATPMSLQSDSPTKGEWKLALDYKKPIVVVQGGGIAPVGRLARRPHAIVGMGGMHITDTIRQMIVGTTTPAGKLQTAQNYLDDASEALKRARGTHHETRFQLAVAEWEQRAKSLSELVSEPDLARQRLDRRVELGLELEREKPSPDPTPTSRIHGSYPVPRTSLFQDRQAETKALCDFFRDPSSRIALVSGRGGIGKSAMVCRVLDGIERGNFPDENGSFSAHSVILLSFKTARTPTWEELRNGLLETAHDKDRDRLGNLLGAPGNLSEARLERIFEEFSVNRYPKTVVVLLDNMEDGIETSTFDFVDQDLDRFLAVLARMDRCAIKVLLTSRLRPRALRDLNPAVFADLPFHEGLPTPYAENFLRSLDRTGAYGLRDAPEHKLAALRDKTRGFPRAIEAVSMQLESGATIDEILDKELADERIIEALVGEALRRLPEVDQLVICTLAAFSRPVPSTAIDFVLRNWFDDIDAATILPRLYNMRFVHRQAQYYALHPVDAANALHVLQSRNWPTSRRFSDSDFRNDFFTSELEPLTLRSIKASAAGYFRAIGLPRRDWKTISDIDDHIAQFNLWVDAGNEDQAAHTLDGIRGFADKQGSFKLLIELAEQLEKISKQDDAKQIALRTASIALWRSGRRTEAASRQKQLITLLESDGEDTSIELANLAIFEFSNGRYWDALERFQSLFDKRFSDGVPENDTVTGLYWLSSCYTELGYLEKAFELQKQAFDTATILGELDALEAQTHNLARCYYDLHEVNLARQFALKAESLAEATRNPLWKANHLSLLATISYRLGDELSAKRYSSEAVAIRKQIGDLEGLANAILEEGEWNLVRGQSAEATDCARKALALGATDGGMIRRANALLAAAALDRKEWREAEHHLAATINLTTDGATFRYRVMLACCFLGLGQNEGARAMFENAATEARELIVRCDANAKAHAGLGWALAGLGTLGLPGQAEAISAFNRARELSPYPGDIAEWLHDVGLLARCRPKAVLGPILEAIDGKSRDGFIGENTMPSLDSDGEKPHRDREALVKLLAKLASDAPRGKYFNNLFLSSRLSDSWRHTLQGLVYGNPETDARAIVMALLNFGDNPADGNSALASLLLALMPNLGINHAATVGSTLLTYDLIKAPKDRERIAARYQIPSKLDASFAQRAGPDLAFATEPLSDQLILQGWSLKEPDFLDVEMLRMAVQRSQSVCRVELPAARTSGTGILVGSDLILTNYHVLAPGGSVPSANAGDAIIRFGAFTDGDTPADKGQVLSLHSNAIVEQSPTDNLDFVLLRTAKPAETLVNVVPLVLGDDEPRKGDDLHILQHPEGGVMKLALSRNSIVSIDTAKSRLQYATRASGGSSGSPCFNGKWRLVGLHHAEIARPFGSVREGIPISAIRDKIRGHLA